MTSFEYEKKCRLHHLTETAQFKDNYNTTLTQTNKKINLFTG